MIDEIYFDMLLRRDTIAIHRRMKKQLIDRYSKVEVLSKQQTMIDNIVWMRELNNFLLFPPTKITEIKLGDNVHGIKYTYSTYMKNKYRFLKDGEFSPKWSYQSFYKIRVPGDFLMDSGGVYYRNSNEIDARGSQILYKPLIVSKVLYVDNGRFVFYKVKTSHAGHNFVMTDSDVSKMEFLRKGNAHIGEIHRFLNTYVEYNLLPYGKLKKETFNG